MEVEGCREKRARFKWRRGEKRELVEKEGEREGGSIGCLEKLWKRKREDLERSGGGDFKKK